MNDLEKQRPTDLSLSSWYELLASLIYIEKNRDSWKIKDDEDALFDALMKQKPQFDIEQCRNAFSVIKRESFI